MIQCQFMLSKMIIQKKNHRPPTPMTQKHYRNEIKSENSNRQPGRWQFQLGTVLDNLYLEKLGKYYFKKGFSVSPKSRKRRKSATKKKMICTGRGCRCGTAFATRKLLLAHYMERQCYKCKKCDMSFQSGRWRFWRYMKHVTCCMYVGTIFKDPSKTSEKTTDHAQSWSSSDRKEIIRIYVQDTQLLGDFFNCWRTCPTWTWATLQVRLWCRIFHKVRASASQKRRPMWLSRLWQMWHKLFRRRSCFAASIR